MDTLELNNSTITNTYNNQVFNTYNEALEFGINDLGWDENDILDRKEVITLEINGEIETKKIDCLMVDSGSDEYVYFLKW